MYNARVNVYTSYVHVHVNKPVGVHEQYTHLCVYPGISAEPLGHGSKIEVTKLPRFKKEYRFAAIMYVHVLVTCSATSFMYNVRTCILYSYM